MAYRALPESGIVSEVTTGHIFLDHYQIHRKLNDLGIDVVADCGAVGNSNHNTGGGTDDTAALLDACAQGQTLGVPVLFPPHRSFRCLATINRTPNPAKPPAEWRGLGGFGFDGQIQYPNIVWDPLNGTDTGPMILDESSTGNMHNNVVRGLRFAGRNIATQAWRMRPTSTNNASMDNHNYMEDVGFAAFIGDIGVVSIEVSGARFSGRNVRFDRINGKCFYSKAQGNYYFENVFVDNWVQAEPGHTLAVFHFDATGAPADYTTFVDIRGMRVEINSDMREINPSGATEAEKCGVIVLTINQTNARIQHRLNVSDWQHTGWSGTRKSHSTVLVMGGASLAENASKVIIRGEVWRGFAGGVGTNDATGDVIPIGNVPSTDQKQTGASDYPRVEFWPGDLGFESERPRSYLSTL